MLTSRPSFSTIVCAAAMLAATVVAACDDAPAQGIIDTRLLDIEGDLAIYEAELDGERRRVEVLVPSDGQAFRILDGDRVTLEVVDGDEWTTNPVSDPTTDAIAEFVLDGGLNVLADDAEFRAGCRMCEIATDT